MSNDIDHMADNESATGRRLDRSQYSLEFCDTFEGPDLHSTKWIPSYLPQWSNTERARARYRLDSGVLALMIEEDQPPWSPEHNGGLRVSNLQTGVFSGPLGSTAGQHKFTEGLIVCEAQTEQRLYTPHYGLIEARVAAIADPACMVALWMIGFEDVPEQSAEICIFEIFGSDIGSDTAIAGLGIHPFGDPLLHDEFLKIQLDADVTDFHTYSADWTPDCVNFYFDDQFVAKVEQSPNYPMQLMLNVYEFEGAPPSPYPKKFLVDWVRGYQQADPAAARAKPASTVNV
ncbi:glycoside hydrolase family 16 protein [Arthrobacter sp. UYEF20]|uniref:glycoside hydrolase family 16 protein n=1 Tax=Arthrobacter sp. UYEF20 TaxID=1756363 RepID=UPI0033916D8F